MTDGRLGARDRKNLTGSNVFSSARTPFKNCFLESLSLLQTPVPRLVAGANGSMSANFTRNEGGQVQELEHAKS